MLFYALIGGLLVSLAASLLLVPLLRHLALKRGWTDAPDGRRKIHKAPIPNVGGVAIVAAFLVGLGVAALLRFRQPELSEVLALPSFLVVLGAVFIAAIGFWDDLRDLSPRAKFAAQIGVSFLVIVAGYRIELFDGLLGGGMLALAVSVVLTLIWMVGIMNAVNMMDGMDGVAAGVVAIAFCGLAGVHALGGDLGALVLAVTVIGALLGFLRYNFNPASIFMGDSGSLFLGFMVATYALRGTGHSHPVLALVVPAVAMGLPILDTMTSMIRRRVQGHSLFAADRDHIHHRLAIRMPYRAAVLTLYALGLFFAGGAMAMAASGTATAAAIFLVGVAVVVTFMHRLGYLGGAPARRVAREKAARRLARTAVGGTTVVAITPREPRVRRRRGAAGRSPDQLAPASSPER